MNMMLLYMYVLSATLMGERYVASALPVLVIIAEKYVMQNNLFLC